MAAASVPNVVSVWPVKRRSKPVEEFEREHVVKELEEFWSKDAAAPLPETPKKKDETPKKKKKDEKDD